jgi:hypothetical protein
MLSSLFSDPWCINQSACQRCLKCLLKLFSQRHGCARVELSQHCCNVSSAERNDRMQAVAARSLNHSNLLRKETQVMFNLLHFTFFLLSAAACAAGCGYAHSKCASEPASSAVLFNCCGEHVGASKSCSLRADRSSSMQRHMDEQSLLDRQAVSAHEQHT